MGDGDEILNEFLFRRALLCIHHHTLALVSLTEMNQQGGSKVCQAVLVGQHYLLDFPRKHLIDQAQKVFAPEIRPAAYFRDPLVHVNVLVMTLLLKHSFLIR
jgi:hypothetical protein